MPVPEDVLVLLVQSSFLDLSSFVRLHIAVKRGYSYMDMAYSTAGSHPFGPARLRFWSRFGSHFGCHVGSLFGSPWAPAAHLVELKTAQGDP